MTGTKTKVHSKRVSADAAQRAVGTYFLVFILDSPTTITIGRRGTAAFASGFYIYVGSALNGLDARIGRHCSADKKKRWHIDYLLEYASVIGVARFETATRIECTLSSTIAAYGGRCVMKKFGASDCACETHLHYFKTLDIAALLSHIKQSAIGRYYSRYDAAACGTNAPAN